MSAIWLILAGLAGAIGYFEYHRWRVAHCDACRIEADGGTKVLLVHTCSRRHALHRDRKGNVTEFGTSRDRKREVIGARKNR